MSQLKMSGGAAGESSGELHAQWLQRAVILLDQGGSEITIINFLSGQGVTPATARSLGAKLYEEARLVVLRKRRPVFIAGWALILAGVLLPIATFFWSARIGIVFFAALPVILGMGLLQKARVRR